MFSQSDSSVAVIDSIVGLQVFGHLLEWDLAGKEAVEGDQDAVQPSLSTHNDSNLREHVVGILFAGNQLTSLQRQVNIVQWL